jgi:hypothetical protein
LAEGNVETTSDSLMILSKCAYDLTEKSEKICEMVNNYNMILKIFEKLNKQEETIEALVHAIQSNNNKAKEHKISEWILKFKMSLEFTLRIFYLSGFSAHSYAHALILSFFVYGFLLIIYLIIKALFFYVKI